MAQQTQRRKQRQADIKSDQITRINLRLPVALQRTDPSLLNVFAMATTHSTDRRFALRPHLQKTWGRSTNEGEGGTTSNKSLNHWR